MIRNAAPAPYWAITQPARAGPSARERLNWMPLRRIAAGRLRGGTIWATKDCQQVMFIAAPKPAISSRPRMRQGVSSSNHHIANSPNAAAALTRFVSIRIHWRE